MGKAPSKNAWAFRRSIDVSTNPSVVQVQGLGTTKTSGRKASPPVLVVFRTSKDMQICFSIDRSVSLSLFVL